MEQYFYDVEAALDKKFQSLAIWKEPIQSILSNLYFFAHLTAKSNSSDDPMAFISRISYMFPEIIKKCSNPTANLSFLQLRDGNTQQHITDYQFLVSYAHLNILVPQVRKQIMKVSSIGDKFIELNFKNQHTHDAELIDRLYSNVATDVVVPFMKIEPLENLMYFQALSGTVNSILEEHWINTLYQHYSTAQFNAQVIPNNCLIQNMGFSYEQLNNFCAAFRAFADFLLCQAKAYEKLRDDESLEIDFREELAIMHSGCVAYQMNVDEILHLQALSGIPEAEFLKILSYYTTVIKNDTSLSIDLVSHCGDGYLPPLTLIENVFVTSPHAIRGLLTANNLLYSMNFEEKSKFDDFVSNELEPTLLIQVKRLLSKFPEVRTIENVQYGTNTGEIDQLILSPKEGVCICIQAKATIAPDSYRSVIRVQDRALHGIKQIKRFAALAEHEQLNVINEAFGTNYSDLKLHHILLVRSSAGTYKSWKTNNIYPIVNYAVLGRVLANKIRNGDFLFDSFPSDIKKNQDQMIVEAENTNSIQTLEISEYKIQFPIIDFEIDKIILENFRTLQIFPDFLKADCQ